MENYAQNKPIFLCGFMGSGKSTIGKQLARLSGREFIDMDNYIEQQQSMTIAEIFEKYGEEYFRELETTTISSFDSSPVIIATGGGTLLSEHNADIAKNLGIVVYINTDFEICYNRIKGDVRRPIAYNSTKQQLLERYKTRKPLYMKHSNSVSSGGYSPRAIAKTILAQWQIKEI